MARLYSKPDARAAALERAVAMHAEGGKTWDQVAEAVKVRALKGKGHLNGRALYTALYRDAGAPPKRTPAPAAPKRKRAAETTPRAGSDAATLALVLKLLQANTLPAEDRITTVQFLIAAHLKGRRA